MFLFLFSGHIEEHTPPRSPYISLTNYKKIGSNFASQARDVLYHSNIKDNAKKLVKPAITIASLYGLYYMLDKNHETKTCENRLAIDLLSTSITTASAFSKNHLTTFLASLALILKPVNADSCLQFPLSDQVIEVDQSFTVQLDTKQIFKTPDVLAIQEENKRTLPYWLKLDRPFSSYPFLKSMTGIVLSDQLAYASLGNNISLVILNISNTQDVRVIGAEDTSGYARDIAVANSTAFIADTKGLHRINISNPRKPKLMGTFPTLSECNRVVVSNGIAFLIENWAKLHLFDVDGKWNFSRLDTISNGTVPGFISNIYVVGETAFVTGQYGLYLINITNSQNISLINSYKNSGYKNYGDFGAQSVVLIETTAFMADSDGLYILNVKDPTNIRLISLLSGFSPNKLTLSNQLGFLADNSNLYVVDLSDLTAPKLLTTYDTLTTHDILGTIWDIRVLGSKLFVASWDQGLQIIDIFQGNLTKIRAIKTKDFNKNYTLEIRAHNCTNRFTLFLNSCILNQIVDRVIDVSEQFPLFLDVKNLFKNPPSLLSVEGPLKLISSLPLYPLEGIPRSIALSESGNIAFVGSLSDGLQIFDVENPANISLLNKYKDPDFSIYDVVIRKNNAFIAGDNGLQILDIKKIQNISKLGEFLFNRDASTSIDVMQDITFLVVGNANQVLILNTSNFRDIKLINTWMSNQSKWINDITIYRNKAFVSRDSYLQILDIQDPAQPFLVPTGYIPYTYDAFSLAIYENFLFVEDKSHVKVLDVTNISNVKLINQYDFERPLGIAVKNKTMLFVTVYGKGIQPIDLTKGILRRDPTSGGKIGQTNFIQINGENCTNTLSLILDQFPKRTSLPLVGFSAFPKKITSKVFYDLFFDLFFDPDTDVLALSSSLKTGFRLPAWLTLTIEPVLKRAISIDGRSFAIQDNKIYVSDSSRGFKVLDENGNELQKYEFSTNYLVAGDIAMYGTNLFLRTDWVGVGVSWGQLSVFNVSNLTSIVWISNFTGLYTSILSFLDDKAFTNDRSFLRVLDISDLKNITLLSSITLPTSVHSMDISGTKLFVTFFRRSGFDIYDVSNISDIYLINSYVTTSEVTYIAASGNTAFVVLENKGLHIFNVADPFNIVQIGAYEKKEANYEYVSVWKDKIAYSTEALGLEILDVAIARFTASPSDNDAGNYDIRLTATDSLGGNVSDTFTLRVEGPPKLKQNISKQYAKVGQTFSYFLQNIFSDPNNDPLTFDAILNNSVPLPYWLSFNTISATFLGIPPEMKNITFIVNVSATDNLRNADNILSNTSTIFELYIDHLPQLNRIISRQLANIDALWNFTIDSDTFIDPDGDSLSLSASLKNDNKLPQWMNFSNITNRFLAIPSTKDNGTYSIQVKATDPNAGQAIGIFDLIVENFPKINRLIENIFIGLGREFKKVIPIDEVFLDLDKEPLIYTLKLIKDQTNEKVSLPEWLEYDFSSHQFNGIPDRLGNYTIQIEAKDPPGASVATQFDFVVVTVPKKNKDIEQIPIQKEGSFLNFTIPPNTFTDEGSNILNYSLVLDSGMQLPDWLTFVEQNLTVLGKLAAGNFLLKLIVTNKYNFSTNITFPLNVVVNVPPVVIKPVSLTSAKVGEFYRPILYMNEIFKDDNKDELSYTVQLDDGKPWPKWLSFKSTDKLMNAYELSGKPGRGDLNFYSDKLLKIRLTATEIEEPKASTYTTFDLKVEGMSYGELLLKVLGPIGSGLTFAYTLWLKQDLIINQWNKWRGNYIKPEVTLNDKKTFVKLEIHANQIHTVQALVKPEEKTAWYQIKHHTPFPGGALLPRWLHYNENENRLELIKEWAPEYTDGLVIRVKDKRGIVREQFPLIVFLDNSTNTEYFTRSSYNDTYVYNDFSLSTVALKQDEKSGV